MKENISLEEAKMLLELRMEELAAPKGTQDSDYYRDLYNKLDAMAQLSYNICCELEDLEEMKQEEENNYA